MDRNRTGKKREAIRELLSKKTFVSGISYNMLFFVSAY